MILLHCLNQFQLYRLLYAIICPLIMIIITVWHNGVSGRKIPTDFKEKVYYISAVNCAQVGMHINYFCEACFFKALL